MEGGLPEGFRLLGPPCRVRLQQQELPEHAQAAPPRALRVAPSRGWCPRLHAGGPPQRLRGGAGLRAGGSRSKGEVVNKTKTRWLKSPRASFLEHKPLK